MRKCGNHRWADWYLCIGHINAIRVNQLILTEELARKSEQPSNFTPSRGGRNRSEREIAEKQYHAVA